MSAPEDLLERIRLRLDESFVGIGEVVGELLPSDVADLVNQLRLQEAATVMSMLTVPRAVEVFDQPTLRRRSAILGKMEPGRAGQILENLSADQRTEIARGLGEIGRRRLLPKLSAEIRAEVEGLLRYPEKTAGGIMTTEFVHLAPTMTGGECLDHVRTVAREKESIYACYVLDPGTKRLLGAVSLRDLVMADPRRAVETVMRKRPITVSALDDQEAVAGRIAKYNLLAVPVLEEDGSVVGFVTVDDVIDVMIEEGTEDVLKMGAVEPGALDEPYTARRSGPGPAARGVAARPLPGRDAHRHRDGPLRAGDRPGGGPRALRPPHHLERRQLRLAGGDPHHPRPRRRRAGLGDWWRVMRREVPRAWSSAGSSAWSASSRHRVDAGPPARTGPLAARRLHRAAGARRGGAVGDGRRARCCRSS